MQKYNMQTANIEEDQDGCLKDPKAFRIYEGIVNSLNEYPHDSNQAKFFLPENITVNCRSIAGAFTMSSYDPVLDPEKVYKTKLYSYFLLALVCGVQIFLKVRSLEKNSSPYSIEAHPNKIKKAQQNALLSLTVKPPIPAYAEEVIIKFLLRLSVSREKENLNIKGKKIYKERIDMNLSSAILWGYYFAKKMVLDS